VTPAFRGGGRARLSRFPKQLRLGIAEHDTNAAAMMMHDRGGHKPVISLREVPLRRAKRNPGALG